MRSAALQFDAGSRGNPGPSAYGFHLTFDNGVIEVARCIGKATNNEAEYSALIAGLEQALELGVTHLRVIGDSKVVIFQVQGV